METYMLDGALYCADCAPRGAADVGGDGGGEADTPQHCDGCGAFLENPLTADGYGYVLDALAAYRLRGRGDRATLETWADFYGVEACDLLDGGDGPHARQCVQQEATTGAQRAAWERAVAAWNGGAAAGAAS